jgi:ATP-dependent DNA ligase
MIDFLKLMDPSILKLEKSDEQFEDADWIQEPKINGRRIQCLINDDVSFAGRYGREGHEDISLLRLKFRRIYEDIVKMKLPKGTLFDGEVYLPGRPVADTLQIINSGIDDAITLQEQYGFLSYVIFDIMAFEDKLLTSKTLSFRKSKLASVVTPTCNIELISGLIKKTDKQVFWKQLLESNHEEKGVVFKFVESEYESDRSKWWKKLKKFDTYDGVITGFNLNEQYPDDFVASIKVSQYRYNRLTHVANISGLTKEQASDFRSKIEYYTGKVIQFISESKTLNSYKNPRLVDSGSNCLRLDKEPQSCVWE